MLLVLLIIILPHKFLFMSVICQFLLFKLIRVFETLLRRPHGLVVRVHASQVEGRGFGPRFCLSFQTLSLK